jgi:hypothetical protein
MRLWFDTNAAIDEERFSLSCTGTQRDLAARNIELQPGMAVTLYMEDPDENGRPGLLLVDAVVEEYKTGLVARIDPDTWRREPE